MKKWSLLSIVITLVSLFVPSSAFAGCYGGCYTPYVHTRVVKEFVPVLAYPVLVPAFQFQYVPPTVVTAPFVPFGVPVSGYPIASPIIQPGYGTPPVAAPFGQYGQPPVAAYGQQGYPQQQQGYPQQQGVVLSSQDKIRELAKALAEELNKLADPNDAGPPAVPGTQPQSQQPQLGQNPYQQPQQTQQNLAQFAVSAMARTCSQCHTGVGSKHDMIIFTQPGLLNQNANWKKIKDEVVSGRMPPKDMHFQLSPQERQTIIQWLTSIGVN